MEQQNKLSVFNYNGFQIRTVTVDGEPWFVAKDVCDVLEIRNTTDAIERLDKDERSRFNLGRQGEVNIVNEPGLYSLILGSRKPEA
jgi:anti-repressor protein